ncbi:hypothetical protein MLD38_014259 [Melastoma candidum]|uniref:Uncharacterized protein n=1 Tax=Melastoma candidum TaxID=119954 RepID=A0ACB9RFC1_9MYRT|nr:hypothetical protein MLD38_014259 [Melastoma candidum]
MDRWVLVVNGKPQCSEVDGFVYYETLVHPALLMHDNLKKVLIMGGGDRSAAREVLKYKTVEHVVLCEIDEVLLQTSLSFHGVVLPPFPCKSLILITDSYESTDFEFTREILKYGTKKFDVTIGDLPAPTEGGGGSCRDLYTKSFYQSILKRRLNEDGIFITHAGMAGVRTHQAFYFQCPSAVVVPVTAAVPLYADTCGWVMASDMPLVACHGEIDKRIAKRIKGKLRYHDGGSILASTIVNKIISELLRDYTCNHLVDDDDATEDGRP